MRKLDLCSGLIRSDPVARSIHLISTERVFGDYFAIFPWDQLPPDAEGFDIGCGSGRWARFVAPRVGRLHCIDPSSALVVARSTLADQPNVQFHQASVAASGLPPNSQDFGYSLGVLHHVPDTAAVTARKDDVSAVDQAAMANVAG